MANLPTPYIVYINTADCITKQAKVIVRLQQPSGVTF